ASGNSAQDQLVNQAGGRAAEDNGYDAQLELEHSNECDKADGQREPIDPTAFGKKDMKAKPDREIQDYAYNRRGDGRKRGSDRFIATQLFDVRSTEKNPEEAWNESRPGSDKSAEGRGEQRGQTHRLLPTAHEPDKLQHHDERAGGCFREAQSVHHLARREPVIMFHCLLRHIRQDGISAAESDGGRFAEEESLLKKGVAPAAPETKRQNRRPPERSPDETHSERAAQRRFRVFGRFAVIIQDARFALAF